MPEEERVDVVLPDGCRIAVERFCSGKRPLVLCHANGFPSGTYRQLISVLLHDHEVYAIDFRGQGNSERGSLDLDLSLLQHAKDVSTVLETLNLQKCNAFGHSMGATTILIAKEISPGLFESVFLYEPVLARKDPTPNGTLFHNVFEDKLEWLLDHRLADMFAKMTVSRKRTFASEEAAFDSFASKVPFKSFDIKALKDYIHYGFRPTGKDREIELRTSPEIEAQTYKDTPPSMTVSPSVINCSVMVAIGDAINDLHSEVRLRSFDLVEQLPKGLLKVFCGLGHFGPFEDPREIGDCCKNFFRRDAVPRSRL